MAKTKTEVSTQARKQTRSGRFYEIPEVGVLPSVTTILSAIGKPALVNWAAKVEREMAMEVAATLYLASDSLPQKMTKAAYLLTLDTWIGKTKASQKALTKAGEIGTQVHSLVEWTMRGELMQEVGHSPKICDEATWAFMAWEDWRRSVKLKPIAVEQVVYSEVHGYAGTLDLLAEVNGELAVIDWKTGKAIYQESHLQNAAYRQAIREMGHGEPTKGYIVRLPKNTEDPQFEVVAAEDEKSSFETFLHTKKLWEWTYANDLKYEAKKKAQEGTNGLA